MTRVPSAWLVYGSLFAGVVLLVVPLPAGVQLARPYLLGMLLCYWLLESPDHVGLGVAFLCGLVADVVAGTLLGEQALRLAIMAFIVQRFRAQLRFFPLSQQALAIAGLLFNDRVVSAVVHLALGEPLLPPAFWWAPLVGMLLWAPVFVMMDRLRLGGRG